MTEKIQYIPARLKNASVGGHVAGADDIMDDALGKAQSVVNEEHEEAISDLQENVGTGGSVDERIAAEKNRAVAAETALANGIEGLTQSEIVVGTLPASGEAGKIYRVPGETSYSDYAWNGSQFVPLAEYDNGIDDEPTAGSDNLVKSGGVAENYGEYSENPEWLQVFTDSESKILQGIKKDSTTFIAGNLQVGGYVINQGIQDQINTKADATDTSTGLASKVDKVAGKSLIDEDFASSQEAIESPEWMQVVLDNNGKVIEGIRKDGQKYIANSELEENLTSQINSVKNELEKEIRHSSASLFANDSEYNVRRLSQQLINVKWTPKGDVADGNTALRPNIYPDKKYPIGVEVTGVPYSSVKEMLKYVGIDVSLHTFMTTVNDPHSLLYTEIVSDSSGFTRRSAYNIVYHGTNSLCYFGSVCSGLVTTALGSDFQWNSWEYQTMFDKFEVLENQDVRNLKVGDILSLPGHCAVLTKVVRDSNGSIEKFEISEHAAPTRVVEYTVKSLTDATFDTKGVWCRYKELYKNTYYKPSTFALAVGENLYDTTDFVYRDFDNSRAYYQCIVPNKDSTFDGTHWLRIDTFSANTSYTRGQYVSLGDDLFKCTTAHTSGNAFDAIKWERVKEIFEWSAYPYVYNNDIVTFAGDRAAFRSNDLIYINYSKGDYTQMQLFKDGVLYKTYNLANDDSYQVNVSSDCASYGMYKARLTDGTNYSRYTYFEVIDTQVSTYYQNGNVEVSFSSANGSPFEVQITEQSGALICHKDLNEQDIINGKIRINPAARLYAERFVHWDKFTNRTNDPIYARVIFNGEYGNVTNEMIYITDMNAIEGYLIYPEKPIDIGIVNGSKNIILADRIIGHTYTVDFEIGSNTSISILNGIETVYWQTELPQTLTQGDAYHVKVDNGVGNVQKINR